MQEGDEAAQKIALSLSGSDDADHVLRESADDSDGDLEESSPAVDDSQLCFAEHDGPVYAVAWNHERKAVVASGGEDDRAFLWTVREPTSQDDRSAFEMAGHSDTVACLAFNSTGDLLASGGLEGQVRIWSASDGAERAALEGPEGGIEWLDWHPRGNVLVAGSEDFSVWLWNAETSAVMQVFAGHNGPVRCGQFLPNGKQIVTGGGDGDESLRLWDPKSGACTLTVKDAHSYHSAGLTVLAVHEDSVTACSGSEDATARIVNLQNGRVLGVLAGHEDSIEAISFVVAMRLIVTGSVDGDLRVWDLSTMALRLLCHHDEAVVRLKCHPTRPIAYTGCLDGQVRCWDLRTGACLASRQGHTQGIQDMDLNAEGSHVLTGSDDGTARVFDFSDI